MHSWILYTSTLVRIHIRCYKLGDSCQVLQVMYALPRHAMKLKACGLKSLSIYIVPSFKSTSCLLVHVQVIFFWSYLTCMIIYNQYSSCNHSVYAICAQCLPPSKVLYFSCFNVCIWSLVPRPHAPMMHLAVCTPFSFGFGSKKNNQTPGGLVIFMWWFVRPDTGK